jgi:hypothetical protein
MSYGHAERNLALIRQLEADTRQLLESLDHADAEQPAWLQTARPALPPPRMPAADEPASTDPGREEVTTMRHAPPGALDVSRLASWNAVTGQDGRRWKARPR